MYSTEQNPNKELFGSRSVVKVIEEEKQVVKDGVPTTKKWKFFKLSPYKWETYSQVRQRVLDIGYGFKHLGLKRGDKVLVFASTGADWMVCAHACFSQGLTIATAYDTLGPEGLLHAAKESDAVAIFTNPELVPVVTNVLHDAPHLTHVFVNGEVSPKDTSIPFMTLDAVRQLGIEHPAKPDPPDAKDIACIMYTSGSTGNPKGVLLSHANLIAAVGGVNNILEYHTSDEDTILAYLPLAHVLEFAVEHCCIFWGVRIGFGSPRTLTDQSVRDCKGDLRELQPTLMAGVPAVWDTIRKAVLSKVNQQGRLVQNVFHAAFILKWKLLQWGMPTGWIDKVFTAIRDQTGGKLRFALSGGAPISAESQRFLSVVMCPILQGYGMTESCGMCTLLAPEMFQLQNVGANVSCVEIKLVDVPDAGYTSKDRPNPRGEVWIRGPAISEGYHKQPDVTAESFTPDGWLMTGDIGVFNVDGTLSIIDRKKNLVKLANGEYIALERLESTYKTSHVVNNMCVVADSLRPKAIALVQPAEKELMRIGQSLGLEGQDYHALCKNDKVCKAVLDELIKDAKTAGLKGTELVADVFLCDEEWTSENGMLTAAQKLKRKDVLKKHKDDIEHVYSRLQ
jgi:long-chain acyl-CoA synthetase